MDIRFGTVKDADEETFVAVHMDVEAGQISRTDFLTEQELRDTLQRGGASRAAIEATIQQARQQPV